MGTWTRESEAQSKVWVTSCRAGLLGRDLELNLRAMETLLICSEFYSLKKNNYFIIIYFLLWHPGFP